MKLVINLEHIPEFKENDVKASLLRIMEHWRHEVLGKPLTIDSLNIAETQTHKFIDSIETIRPSGHRYWGGRMSGLYLESVFLKSRLNDHIHQSPFKPLSPIWWGCDMCQEQQQEPAIRAIAVDLAEFALIESENQHAFITHTDDLKVGQKVALKNPKADKAIVVEIDKVIKSKTDYFINEFSLFDFD